MPPAAPSAGRKPLLGLNVIESGGVAAGLLGRMLADLGATVRKVDEDRETGSPPVSVAACEAAFGLGKTPLTARDLPAHLPQTDVLIWNRPGPLPPPLAGARDAFARLIVVSLTPFGATGPYADRPSSDLVTTAMSGYLNLCGNPGEAPVKPSVPFASDRHAAYQALCALLIAIRHRRRTGKGALVDLAARDAGLWMLTNAYQFWDISRFNLTRKGSRYSIGDMTRMMPSLFDCKDGQVVWMPLAGRSAAGTVELVSWMKREDAAPDWLAEMDWARFELHTATQIERFLAPFRAFFLTKTRAELFAAAIRYGTLLAPVRPFSELLDDPQLAARNAWAHHPAIGARLPRAPVGISTIDWSSTDQEP